ncbi:MAG: MogA/MoaB family molybdenum cofactor biosynthesis protein [Nocardiopsaceae bacterium]|nr:MogA/MoaB family molybdenum cofactor biosynthesis protein [Nocardiopsaceae bacterium]
MIRALAVTVSNRAAAGVYEDRSGPVLVELLRQAGCDVVDGPLVIPDGEAVEQVLRDSVTADYDVAVTTGGTGLTPTDQTPEMTRRVIDREIPGIAEALRGAGAAAGVPSAILSRGLAGVASRTLIVNLPGSSGGVRDGMTVLRQVLVHAVDQIRGGDHPRPSTDHSRPSGEHPRPAIEHDEHDEQSEQHAEQGHLENDEGHPPHGDPPGAPGSAEHSAGIA